MPSDGTSERRLLLLRHAKAERPGALADEMRPLALRGRSQAAETAAALRGAGLVPDLVLVSSAVRTRQTWEIARGVLLQGDVARVEVLDALYDAGLGELLEVVRAHAAAERTVLVVGHEPVMSAAASVVAGRAGDEAALAQVRTGLPTGTCAVLRHGPGWDELGPGSGELMGLVRPAS